MDGIAGGVRERQGGHIGGFVGVGGNGLFVAAIGGAFAVGGVRGRGAERPGFGKVRRKGFRRAQVEGTRRDIGLREESRREE